MNRILIFYCSFFLFIILPDIEAQNEIKLTKLVGGLSKPLFITNAGDERLFVVEQAGKIKIIQGNKVEAEPFLNITDRVNSRNNEQGLLGLAFHPEYKKNGLIYVNYISNGANRTIVSRFNLIPGNSNKVDSLSEKILLVINQPFSNHNGGCLNFGPDGYLYIGMGDGGSANDPQGNGQNKKTMLAKMLRIDINTNNSYEIPTTNPFVNDTSYLPEIWALGLRNPWRWSFDRLNGDLWIGDVGQDTWEEVDYTPASSNGGENYGWRCYEGLADFNQTACSSKNNFVFPIQVYKHNVNADGCSITGGYVYRGLTCSYLYGQYIYADYCSGYIWAIKKLEGIKDSFVNRKIYQFAKNQISSFGEDVHGEMYLCALAEGSVYSIADTCHFDYKIISKDPDCVDLSNGSIQLESSTMGCEYTYQWSTLQSQSRLDSLSAGTYTVTLTYAQCQTTEKIKLSNKINKDTACITPLFVDKICDGDSALIIACTSSGKLYQWMRNGVVDSTLHGQRIFVKQGGSYVLSTRDSIVYECISYPSDTIWITVHPLPSKPMLEIKGDTLRVDAGFPSYVWYLNGNLIAGSTQNYYIVRNKGFYQVEIIDSNQCRSVKSDSIFVIPTGIHHLLNQGIIVMPNPGNGEYDFIFGDRFHQDDELQILTLDSKLILRQKINSDSKNLKISLYNYADGTYLYRLIQNSNGKIISSGLLLKK